MADTTFAAELAAASAAGAVVDGVARGNVIARGVALGVPAANAADFLSQSIELRFSAAQYRYGLVTTTIPTDLRGFAFSRAGTRLARDADGTYRRFRTGNPRITDQGFKHAGASVSHTNMSSIADNATPLGLPTVGRGMTGDAAATLTLVDQSAALINGGFGDLIAKGEMNGNALFINNTAGAATATMRLSGTVGVTGSVTVRAVLWGTGQVALRTNSVSNSTFFLTATPTLYSFTLTTANAGDQFQLNVNAGSVCYTILEGIYPGTGPDFPIPIHGASATVGAEVASLALPTAIDVVTVVHSTGVVAAKKASLLSTTSLDLMNLNAQPWGMIGDYVSGIFAMPARPPEQYILALFGQSNMAGGDGLATDPYATDNANLFHRTVIGGTTTEAALAEPLPFSGTAPTGNPWTPGVYAARRLRDFYNASKVIVLPDALGGTALTTAASDNWSTGGSRRQRAKNNLASAVAAYPNAKVIILWSQGEQDAADNAGAISGGTLTVDRLTATYQAAEEALFREFMAIAPNAKIVIGGMVPEWIAENNHTERGAIERAHIQTAANMKNVAYIPGPVGFAGSETAPGPGKIHYVNAAQPGRGYSWTDVSMTMQLPLT